MKPNENELLLLEAEGHMIIPKGTEHFKVMFDPTRIQHKPTDRVCVIDGDGSEDFPNLALQKLSAWEKRNGVREIKIIKLKHTRDKRSRVRPKEERVTDGSWHIADESLLELEQIKDFDRVYASFIFTRSKPVIAELKTRIPHVMAGGTGVDEYYPMQPGDKRARPKMITQLPDVVENMYPDHELYESEHAEDNVTFWSDPSSYKATKKVRDIAQRQYGIKPKAGGWGGVRLGALGMPVETPVVSQFVQAMLRNGVKDGTQYRGSTRGNGYSTKGCIRKCTFCVVPIIQGDIQPMHYGLLGVINWVLPIGLYPTMDEIVDLYNAELLEMRPHLFFEVKKKKITKEDGTTETATEKKLTRISPFLTISDNNFPADPTCLDKMAYMIENDIAVNINQGMDARLLTVPGHWEVIEGERKTFRKEADARKWCEDHGLPFDSSTVKHPSGDEICAKLARLYFINFHGTYRQMHFSWDYIGVGRAVLKGLRKLVEEYGLKYRNFMVYCLSGFDTDFETEDLPRVMTLKKLGIDPFIMPFRNIDGSENTKADGSPQDWRLKHLARQANNKILFRKPFHEYEPYLKELEQRKSGLVDDEAERLAALECFDWLIQEYIKVA